MFGKVEDELDFDVRQKAPEKRQAWSEDNHITYEEYAHGRCLFEKAKDYIEFATKTTTMHRSMRKVFYFFIISFSVEVGAAWFYSLYKFSQTGQNGSALLLLIVVPILIVILKKWWDSI